MKKLFFAFAAIPAFSVASALAQQPNNRTPAASVTIKTGNTFQQVLAASKTDRKVLAIQNSNTNGDSCWIFFGSDKATKANSILLSKDGQYTRYWPFIPSDAIQVTCVTSEDVLSVKIEPPETPTTQGR